MFYKYIVALQDNCTYGRNKMKLRSLYLFCVLIASMLSQQAIASELVGKTLFTQVNIYSLKGKVVTWVNYHVDALIPVNSEVVVEKIRGSGVVFVVKKTGQRLKLKNKQRHSGLSGEDWANKHFASKKVNLSKFSKLERNAIAAAEVKKGMGKKAVLVAYGYPPAHKTPSLEASQWLYWITRWNKIVVTFDGNRVSNVRS